MMGISMMCSRRTIGATLGVVLGMGAMEGMGIAQTQGAPGTHVDSSARAVQIYTKGNLAAKNERWQEAYEAYAEAWKIKQHFQIAANLGRAELRLGKHRDAAEH